jgi:hypothetical protein
LDQGNSGSVNPKAIVSKRPTHQSEIKIPLLLITIGSAFKGASRTSRRLGMQVNALYGTGSGGAVKRSRSPFVREISSDSGRCSIVHRMIGSKGK